MEIRQTYLTNNPCYQANVEVADSRYAAFQGRGPAGLMLHAVGCAQPSAAVFVSGWNQADYDRACVHAFIDANTGIVWQTLPWNFRGWHCGGSGNDTHVGVELCESGAIRYTGANRFEILDRETALADARRTYAAAVSLFAALCAEYGLDPLTTICSHKEGWAAGIASNHGDPEHYWSGLGLSYRMDGFRADVAAAMAAAAEAPTLPAPEPSSPEPSVPEPSASEPSAPEPSAPEPAAEADSALPFSDTAPDDWYADALRWALAQRIVQPSPGPFRPENPLTKAAAVVWLRRMYRLLTQESG